MSEMSFKEMVDDLKLSAYLACKNVLESSETDPKVKNETARLVFEVSGDLESKRTGPQGKTNYTQINFSDQLSEENRDGLKALFGAVHEETRNVSTEPPEEDQS
jgi:hypothetical protein